MYDEIEKSFKKLIKYKPFATLIFPIVEKEAIKSFLVIVCGKPLMKIQSVQSEGRKEFSFEAATSYPW